MDHVAKRAFDARLVADFGTAFGIVERTFPRRFSSVSFRGTSCVWVRALLYMLVVLVVQLSIPSDEHTGARITWGVEFIVHVGGTRGATSNTDHTMNIL